MTEHLKTTLLWLTTSGIKIIGILVAFFILSQMSLPSPCPFLGRNRQENEEG